MTTFNRTVLSKYHQVLSANLKPMHWWPAETPFEVCIGAILTQNTTWKNVEKAIANLKTNDLLNVNAIAKVPVEELALVIRSSGYFNQKARKIKAFVKYFISKYDGEFKQMAKVGLTELREELLNLNGIGPETADSILLYALDRPSFVVDSYTRRILSRHGLVAHDIAYSELRSYCMANVPTDVQLYNEFHAQLVYVGHHYCKRTPRCHECALQDYLPVAKKRKWLGEY